MTFRKRSGSASTTPNCPVICCRNVVGEIRLEVVTRKRVPAEPSSLSVTLHPRSRHVPCSPESPSESRTINRFAALACALEIARNSMNANRARYFISFTSIRLVQGGRWIQDAVILQLQVGSWVARPVHLLQRDRNPRPLAKADLQPGVLYRIKFQMKFAR